MNVSACYIKERRQENRHSPLMAFRKRSSMGQVLCSSFIASVVPSQTQKPKGRVHSSSLSTRPLFLHIAYFPLYPFFMILSVCAGQNGVGLYFGTLRKSSGPCLINTRHDIICVKSRYSDWLRAGRPRDRSSSPSRVKNVHFSMSPKPVRGST
jgi:hypothetical protein